MKYCQANTRLFFSIERFEENCFRVKLLGRDTIQRTQKKSSQIVVERQFCLSCFISYYDVFGKHPKT